MTERNLRFKHVFDRNPHEERRKTILEAHPEIKQLFRHDPSLCFVSAAIVLSQLTIAFLVAKHDVSWVFLVLESYCAGATYHAALIFVLHDIAHSLAFGHKHPMANKVAGIATNIPMVIPFTAALKKYHMPHHRHLGEERHDSDMPTEFECRVFRGVVGKAAFQAFYNGWMGIRMMVAHPRRTADLEFVSLGVQCAVNILIWQLLGGKALVYLLLSSLFAMGLHPTSGHAITDHFELFGGQKETLGAGSYYGPLNHVFLNGGFHAEHHDFPNVPGRSLPLVREAAPEFYANLAHQTSLLWCIKEFIFNPNMGLRCYPIRSKTTAPSPREQFRVVNHVLEETFSGKILRSIGFYKMELKISELMLKTFPVTDDIYVKEYE